MNKKYAAKYLDVSVRTIERYSQPGPNQKLFPSYIKGPHGLEADYDADQLDSLKKASPAATPQRRAKESQRPSERSASTRGISHATKGDYDLILPIKMIIELRIRIVRSGE